MAANVETMMYAGETPWHGIGVPVPANVTSEEALTLACLNWTVSKRAIFTANPATGLAQKVPGYAAIVRDSDEFHMAVMGDGYKPMQNVEAFDFADAIVGSKHAIYNTAGALDHGRRVFMLAELPGEIRIAKTEDVTKKFLLFATSHDGSLATVAKLTPVRVVCQNTLNVALRGEGEFIKIRHTKNAETKVKEAQRVLGIAGKHYDEFAQVANFLAVTKFSEKQMKGLAETLFPANAEGEVSARAVTSRDMLVDLFENGKGQNMVRGSAWAAFNAVTEFTDWHRTTRVTGGEESTDESQAAARLNSVWFGSGAAMKQKAFNAIQSVIA